LTGKQLLIGREIPRTAQKFKPISCIALVCLCNRCFCSQRHARDGGKGQCFDFALFHLFKKKKCSLVCRDYERQGKNISEYVLLKC